MSSKRVRWEKAGRYEYLIEVLPKDPHRDSVRWRVLGAHQPSNEFFVTDIACTDVDPPIELFDLEGTYKSVTQAISTITSYLDPNAPERFSTDDAATIVFEPAVQVMESVEEHGSELILSPDGLLQARGWDRISPSIRAEESASAYEIVAMLCLRADYRLTGHQVEELRGRIEAGSLDDISVTLYSLPRVAASPGQAGVQARYWIRRYDVNGGHPRDEAGLRGIYYGALAYWHRREQR